MNYVLSLGREIIEKRKLIWDLGKADFRKRFVGSYFGIVWMFIQPIVTIAIYAIIFGPAGFRTPPPVPGASYVAWLVAGIVPWFFYSEVLNTVTNCLQEYSYLVKKVVFKVEILPIIKLMSCLMVHGFFVLIMLGLYLVTGVTVRVTWLQALYYTFAASMLALGILLLEMQPSQYALDGHGLVVLYEHHVETCFLKIILIVGLHKIASLILKNCRFNHIQPLDVAGGHFNLSHKSIRSFFIVKHA